MTKEHIIGEIKRVAATNGAPPGKRTFEQATGIREGDWFGVHWARWGDALVEAGLSPNPIQPRLPDDVAFRKYAVLAKQLGHLPAKGELKLARRSDPTFPSLGTFAKYGTKRDLAERILRFCESASGLEDVARMCQSVPRSSGEPDADDDTRARVQGYVYLLKSGRHFKIGKSNAVGRRERELAIQLPEEVKRVHVIETDDPSGIEAYWHTRFSQKRANGEWFNLDAADVRAFKRRRYQ